MWLEGVKAKQTTSTHGRMAGRSISVLLRISCFLSSFFLVHYFYTPPIFSPLSLPALPLLVTFRFTGALVSVKNFTVCSYSRRVLLSTTRHLAASQFAVDFK